MKKHMLWLILTAVLSGSSVVAREPVLPMKSASQMSPTQEQAQAATITAQYLSYHYRALPLDDAMSLKIFDRYLKSLDADKSLFLQADIDQFSTHNTLLDDAIKSGNLAAPFAMFGLYQQRFNERYAYARELLKKPFDFTTDENYAYNREKAAWAKTEEEVRELWRKRVKNDWLRLKLAGKDEKAIRETLDKRYENHINRFAKLNQEDVFQTFLNAYTTSIDPHTNYLGPRAAENFNISMRLSLIGIGAVLQQKDEYTVIRELVPGGPAAMSGKFKVGDRIVGVGQGESGSMTDVLGWRLDDVVALIRGNKDTSVRLDVLPAEVGLDGKHKVITLARKKINMEDQAAKKSVMTVPLGEGTQRVGVISLPTFYMDFEARGKGDKNFRSATRDVARLLAELKKEKVDSVLIDLRNNGGGSLYEAVELTGLFIDKGPVVMQRDSTGKVRVESDTKPGFEWDGPLGVLINRGSASASEIFAAAIQDYGRGVVIGEQSFGKGSVQTLLNLDKAAANAKPKLGDLKLTMAQFFRVNGGATQVKGVMPDVVFPSFSDAESFGESSYENALPWTSIKPADYTPHGDLHEHFATLLARHKVRIAKDKEFQFLLEDIAEYRKQQKDETLSLNEAVRRKEIETREARTKARQKITGEGVATATGTNAKKVAAKSRNATAARQDDGLLAEERNLEADLAAEKEQKNAKDVLLAEAVKVMADEVDLLKHASNPKLAERPASAAGKAPAKMPLR